ncbi:LysE family translocator [Falsirhodobacter deserti]|uniref:LysE family translocator n=1 Tax=Falsirhodobacter deserti TaxID=1365611 RepID=UPI000FE3B993|nr:LysE family transporter [Falsirhodobacter deserti]
MSEVLNQLLVVYGAYLIATASPGPSNMAIMGVAMSQGRQPALAVAAGVVAGSMAWAVLAATGLSVVLAAWAHALFAIKIVGGLYLLYLAYRSARSALAAHPADLVAAPVTLSYRVLFRRGLLLHIANPKAVLAWVAIMSLGLRPGMPTWTLQAVIAGCALLGIAVFGGYALVFSTPTMVRGYRKASKWIEIGLAAFFGIAGLRVLTSRS